MKNPIQLNAITTEESNHLKGFISEMKSYNNNSPSPSLASIGDSHLTELNKSAGLEGGGWLREDINIIFASPEDYGDIASTSYTAPLTGALAPSTKRRFGVLHMFSGLTAKGDNPMSANTEEATTEIAIGAIFGVIKAFLPFLGVLTDLLGKAIKSWNDFIAQLDKTHPKDGKQNISKAFQSESELAKKIKKTPPKKLATPPKGNFPKMPISSIKSISAYGGTVQASSNDSAGAYIYFHSLDDNQYYGPLEYNAAEHCQLEYPANGVSQPFELPRNCDHIAMLWKNKPVNATENGGIWGKISFYE